MFSISLKQLNDSYQSLLAIGQTVNKGKIKYRLGRTLASAKAEVELMQKHLADVAERNGAELTGGGGFNFKPEQTNEIKAFNKEADDFMRSQKVELWGDAEYFRFAEFEAYDIAANDIANLLWLIGDDEPAEEKPKAQAAAA